MEIKIKDPVEEEETEPEEAENEPIPPIKAFNSSFRNKQMLVGSLTSIPFQLTYFDLKAEAEYLRLLLAAAGFEYEDNRMAMGSQELEEMRQGENISPSDFAN